MKILVLFFSLLLSLNAWSVPRTEIYAGTAKDKNGKVVYLERHVVQFDANGAVTTAETTYSDTDGTVLGIMASDFTKNLTAPTYTYKDNRFNNEHGVRLKNDDYILFNKDKDGKEKTKILKKDFAKDALVVGCQGLHYYLRNEISKLSNKGTISIKFLIPGDLDYYSFRMRVLEDKGDILRIEIVIDNVFLRLFAPSLVVEYDKKNGRLLDYIGISNIKSNDNKVQTVKITYDYDTK